MSVLAGLPVLFGAVPPALVAGPAPGSPASPPSPPTAAPLSWGQTVARDYGRFYTGRRLGGLAVALALGGSLANTDADQELFLEYRAARDGASSSWAESVSGLGEGAVVLPAIIAPALFLGLGERPEEGPLAAWWRRSARAYLVGGPAFYYLQQLTGGSRPGEPEGSRWQPFQGNHGISGHAFLGAVPLLTAARLSEARWARAGLFVLSLAPGVARLEEEEHFPSQVLLGWFLAWQATGAVADASAQTRRQWELVPLLGPDGEPGAGVALRLP